MALRSRTKNPPIVPPNTTERTSIGTVVELGSINLGIVGRWISSTLAPLSAREIYLSI